MNFYVITNGWNGNGYCRVYVSAENEDRAKELASEIFKNENDRKPGRNWFPKEYHALESMSVVFCLDGNTEGIIDQVDD